ncbi:hypothetical protein HXX76_014480 [Chlamydomonas incerta]|uniref:Protein kinase domain-containing protein n=1 Tax=Chlamydomonas incerta TaxID=51695 RepID=A0A835SGJ3_CHLIN|nr:hypothetical protein HXX76_014480 [Chlamydomonas incerta]|eukprot:KAG2424427.1 hypothetical protein HXX76_014480 [Chlamydomonas incerta]
MKAALLAGAGAAVIIALARRADWLRALICKKLPRSKPCDKYKACDVESRDEATSTSHAAAGSSRHECQLVKTDVPTDVASTSPNPPSISNEQQEAMPTVTPRNLNLMDQHVATAGELLQSTSTRSSSSSSSSKSSCASAGGSEDTVGTSLSDGEQQRRSADEYPTSPSNDAKEAPASSMEQQDQEQQAYDDKEEEEEYYDEEYYDEYYDEEEEQYEEDPAYMSDEAVKAFVAEHGLRRCVFQRELGKGATARVDLVAIPLPDGTRYKAARKTLLPDTAGGTAAGLRAVLQRELDGLAAAAGCADAVQCLGFRLPEAEGESAEVLLSYAEGGSVEDLLIKLSEGYFGRIFAPGRKKRTGVNKHKYEMLPYPGSTLMEEADLRAMLRAMVRTVQHMNGRGFAHFDLKPANLLFDYAPDGSKVFRVCDFNVAVKADSSGRVARAPGGTPCFCAAEVLCQLMTGLQREHPISLAADVASMGLVLADAAGLHCLAGGTLAYALYERDLPRRTPPALKELIEWMVAADPAARPRLDQVLAHRWLTEEQ